MQNAGSKGIGEVVKGEREEAEIFPIPLLRPGHGEQVVRGIRCVDGVRDVVKVLALFAGFHPFWDMGVYVRHHEVYPSSSLSASCPVRTPICVRITVAYEYIAAITQVFEGLVDLLLYEGRRSAGAGAEIDECIVGDGGAEDGLERASDEGGGGCRLEDWGFVFPEEGEYCLDGGAERSGKPVNGWVALVFVGDGMEVRTKTGRRSRRDEVEG